MLVVAEMHTITAGMRASNRTIANGRQNRRMPVNLLVIECGTERSRCLHDPIMMPASFALPMAAIHNHIHKGKSIVGRISMAAQMTNTRSARLSITAPRALTASSFLATGPSIISETPPQQYNAQNPVLKTEKNSIVSAATPLDKEIMLGTEFIHFLLHRFSIGKSFLQCSLICPLLIPA